MSTYFTPDQLRVNNFETVQDSDWLRHLMTSVTRSKNKIERTWCKSSNKSELFILSSIWVLFCNRIRFLFSGKWERCPKTFFLRSFWPFYLRQQIICAFLIEKLLFRLSALLAQTVSHVRVSSDIFFTVSPVTRQQRSDCDNEFLVQSQARLKVGWNFILAFYATSLIVNLNSLSISLVTYIYFVPLTKLDQICSELKGTVMIFASFLRTFLISEYVGEYYMCMEALSREFPTRSEKRASEFCPEGDSAPLTVD